MTSPEIVATAHLLADNFLILNGHEVRDVRQHRIVSIPDLLNAYSSGTIGSEELLASIQTRLQAAS